MMPENAAISLTGQEAVAILKEIEVLLISLHNIGSYYIGKDKAEYERETNRFIDDWRATHRLAEIRRIITEKFDLTLGDDDMDDLERAMEGLKYWTAPGDNPVDAHRFID